MAKIKKDEELLKFIGFSDEQQRIFNSMTRQISSKLRAKSLPLPKVVDNQVTMELLTAHEWLMYTGMMSSQYVEFQLYYCFNEAYNSIKWDDRPSTIALAEYKKS
jgi:hypothetical protein